MKRVEFRRAVKDLLSTPVDSLSLAERLAIIEQALVEIQSEGFDESNKGKPWTDDELRHVLRHAPTKANCIELARAFKRGFGSIEQIFRWAATAGPTAESKRPDDAFVKQIKRVAKEVGWRATS